MSTATWRKYGCEVTRDRRYVCPKCGKPVTDLEAVRKRLDGEEGLHHLPGVRREGAADRLHRAAAQERSRRAEDSGDGRDGHARTRHPGAGANPHRPHDGHRGEANQIFRPVTMFDYGIDGEVEFKDNDGKASGKRIYIQLKSGNSYLRTRKERRQRGLRREERAPPRILDQPAGGRVSRHPPDGRDERPGNRSAG